MGAELHQESVMVSQLSSHLWIDGEWVDGQKQAQSINPATGEVIGTYTEAGEATTPTAEDVGVARQASVTAP